MKRVAQSRWKKYHLIPKAGREKTTQPQMMDTNFSQSDKDERHVTMTFRQRTSMFQSLVDSYSN